jgi:hypothetical protein
MRCVRRSLVVAAVRWRHAAAPPRHRTQVCLIGNKSHKPALGAPLAAAAPWSSRLPVAVACCSGV